MTGLVALVLTASLFVVQAEPDVAKSKAELCVSDPDCRVMLRAPSSVKTDISKVLTQQQAAWNAGDIDAFMSGYWNSDDVRFASGGEVTMGWAETLAGYKARYDTPEKMGRLEFADLDIDLLTPGAAMAFGRWTVVREGDDPTGLFTLIFKRIGGEWVIVHDHTSTAE